MRRIAAFLAIEVDLAVASAASRRRHTRPSFGLTLFIDAQGSINVPSTKKWSVDKSRLTLGWARIGLRNFAAMSPSSSRN
jgi:hypothetical protein